jgi:hypothetical protein
MSLCPQDELGASVSGALAEIGTEPVGVSRTSLAISAIRGDIGIRAEGADAGHVAVLAELAGPVPPIVVHRPTMTVVDGVHRLLASARSGRSHIDAILVDGDFSTAFVLGVRLNCAHGLPLSQRDRRAAVSRILADHPDWSDRRIAAMAGVSPKTVGAARRSNPEVPVAERRIGRDGRSRPVEARRGPEWRQPFVPKQSGLVPVVGTTPARLPDALARLRQDPSLRDNEAGRRLLWLLSSQVLDAAKILALAQVVPSHRLPDVVEAARGCADGWCRFAEMLTAAGEVGSQVGDRSAGG